MPDPTHPCTVPQPSLSFLTCEMRTKPPYHGGWLPGSREETGAVTALWEEDRVKGTTSTDLITAIFLGLFGARGGGVTPVPLLPKVARQPHPLPLGSLKVWHPQLQP